LVGEIDILIPVARKSNFIEDALISAHAQQGVKVKIYILENNVSDIAFSNYLRNISNKYNAEYVVFQERLNLFENWNRCLSIGNSEWIAFLHDDDIMAPDYLKYSSLFFYNKDILVYPYEYFSSKSRVFSKSNQVSEILLSSPEQLVSKVFLENVHMSSLLFRRSVKFNFPTQLKMLGDQYAFRTYIFANMQIRVGYLNANNMNQIRVHQLQATSRWGYLCAEEYLYLWQSSFAILEKNNRLNLNKIIYFLVRDSDANTLSKIASSLLYFKWTCFKVTTYALIIFEARSLKLFFSTIFRALFQKTVWEFKYIQKR
jgi:hypothetical protein